MTDRVPRWFAGDPLPEPGPGRFLFTTNKYPVYYLQITKCGSSYMRNLIYHLDHGTAHPDSKNVHSYNQDFVKADLVPRDVLRASPFLFCIVRDPVDRFLSLYFDKIANLDNEKDAAMRRRVVRKAGIELAPRMGLSDHQQNALLTINWFGRNLERGLKGKINPHWQRQKERLSRLVDLNARLVTLDGLPWQLPALLSPVIPDIAQQMDAVRIVNQSTKPFSKAQMLTPELEETIHAVYAQDLETYQMVRSEWGKGPVSERA